MRTLLIGLLLITVACRRPSSQFTAMLTPVNQPDDYSRYLTAGDELVALGSEPYWSLTINPSKGVVHVKSIQGDSSTMPLADNRLNRNSESADGSLRYQTQDGRFHILFRPDSCRDKLSGQRFDYRVAVTSPAKTYVGCGVSLQQLAMLQGNWVLTSLQGNPVRAGSSPNTVPRLDISLSQSRVTGTTGCNQLHGTVRADTRHLVFGPLTTTKMACMNEAGTNESTFLQALNLPLTYRIDNGNLVLLQNTKPVMSFKRVE